MGTLTSIRRAEFAEAGQLVEASHVAEVSHVVEASHVVGADEMAVPSETPALRRLPGQSLVRVLQLASQSLPTGAFAYSSGLEKALDLGHFETEESAAEYVVGLVGGVLGNLELPLFLRMLRAEGLGKRSEVERWTKYARASRESRELQEQDSQMARALARVLRALDPTLDDSFRPISFAEAFARAACFYDLSEEEALSAYAFSWVEQHVTALARLMALGPLAMQRLMDRVLSALPSAIDHTLRVRDEDLGFGCPGLAIASALHETQYTRLFRS